MHSSPITFKLMNGLFDDRMNGIGSGVDGTIHDTPTVKTYILENIGENRDIRGARQFLTKVFSQHPSNVMKGIKCVPSSKDAILHVTGRLRKEEFSAYIDYSSPRYLRLHSMVKSATADDVVAGWTTHEAAIDQAWFYDSFLEACASRGQFRGLKIEYSAEPLQPSTENEDLEDSVNVRQSGRDVGTMLDLLRSAPAFQRKSTLSMVRLSYPRNRTEQRVTSEVRYDGRIAARGNSFDRHSQLVDRLLARYAEEIANVEHRFEVCAKPLLGGWQPRVKPLRIDLNAELEDVEGFCNHLFSASHPFRLSGEIERIGENHYAIQAIDLHTGQLFPFEITRSRIWLTLPQGSCGNTFFRLFTNLQRHYSRLITCDQVFGGPRE